MIFTPQGILHAWPGRDEGFKLEIYFRRDSKAIIGWLGVYQINASKPTDEDIAPHYDKMSDLEEES